MFTGDTTDLRERLRALACDAAVDELLIAAPIHGHTDRLASYERTHAALVA